MATPAKFRTRVARRILSTGEMTDERLRETQTILHAGTSSHDVDLSCRDFDADSIVLLRGLTTSMGITVLNLQCSRIGEAEGKQLLEIVRGSPTIVTVLLDGAVLTPPASWHAALQDQCQQNKNFLETQAAERTNAEERARQEAKQHLFDEQIKKIVQEGLFNSDIQFEESKERRMLRAAWKCAVQLVEDEKSKMHAAEVFLRSVIRLVQIEEDRRVTVQVKEISERFAAFQLRVDAHHAALETDESNARRNAWKQRVSHHALSTKTLNCRTSMEKLHRAELEYNEVLERNRTSAEERAAFLPFDAQYNREREALIARIREARQREEDDRRRARMRHEDDLRDHFFKLERASVDILRNLHHVAQSFERTTLQEIAKRDKISAAERFVFPLFIEAFHDMADVLNQREEFLLLQNQFSTVIGEKPFIRVCPSRTDSNPTVLFEDSGASVYLDEAFEFEYTLRPSWEDEVVALKFKCNESVAAYRLFKKAKAKRIRANWDLMVTSLRGVDVRCEFIGDSFQKWMPLLFVDEFSDRLAGLNEVSEQHIKSEKCIATAAKVTVTLRQSHEDGQQPTDDKLFLQPTISTIEGCVIEARGPAGTVSFRVSAAPIDLSILQSILRRVEFKCCSRVVGESSLKEAVVRVELNDDVAETSVPIVVLRRFFVAAGGSESVAESRGLDGVPIGSPWSVLNVPCTTPKVIVGSDGNKEVDLTSCSSSGFAGYTVSTTVASETMDDLPHDKIYFDSAVIRIILGVVQLDGLMIGRIESGTFTRDGSTTSSAHTMTIVPHRPFTSESLVRLLDALRFANVTKYPVVGLRTLTVVISPSKKLVGPKVVLPFHVKAVDLPTEIQLPDRRVFLRSSCWPPATSSLFEKAVLSSVRVANNGSVVDADTNNFCGGYFTASIEKGAHFGDHLWMTNTDGRGMNLRESSRPGLHIRPPSREEEEFSLDASVSAMESSVRMPTSVPVVQLESDKPFVEVWFEEKRIGTMTWQMFSFDDFRSDFETTQPHRTGTMSKTSRKSKKPAALSSMSFGPIGVKKFTVEFTSDGAASVRAVQEMLRHVEFCSTQMHPMCGSRDVAIEVFVGQAVLRVDSSGNLVLAERQNKPAQQMVLVKVTPSLFVSSTSEEVELAYMEKSGEKRLPPMELLEDVESSTFWFPPGNIKVDVIEGGTDEDILGVMEPRELLTVAGKRITIQQPKSGIVELSEDLAAVYEDYLYYEPTPPAAYQGPSNTLKVVERKSSLVGSLGPPSLYRRLSASRKQSIVLASPQKSEAPLSPQSEPADPLSRTVNEESFAALAVPPSIMSEWLPFTAPTTEPVIPVLGMTQGTRVVDIANDLALRGIDRRFAAKDAKVRCFRYSSEGAVTATAYAVPKLISVSWSSPISRKDLVYILRSLSYCNRDANPKILEKRVRITLFDGSSTSNLFFKVKLVPVDDPLEVIVQCPIVPYRINATERCHYDADLQQAILDHREAFAPQAKSEPEELEGLGVLTLFPMGKVTLVDPDTEFWDNGAISIDVQQGWTRTEELCILTIAQQAVQWRKAGKAPEMFIRWCSGDPSSKKLELTDGDLNVSCSPMCDVSFGKGAQSLNVTLHPAGTFDRQFVTLDILGYIVNCLALRIENEDSSTVPMAGTRQMRLVITDGRNPIPSKTMIQVDVKAPIIAARSGNPFSVSAINTRTKSAMDSYQIFQKFSFVMQDRSYSVESGGYIEVLVLPPPMPEDELVLRLNGTSFTLKDDRLIGGKDDIARIVCTPSYIRVDFTKGSKAITLKRLTEFVRSIFLQFTAIGTRNAVLSFFDAAERHLSVVRSQLVVQ